MSDAVEIPRSQHPGRPGDPLPPMSLTIEVQEGNELVKLFDQTFWIRLHSCDGAVSDRGLIVRLYGNSSPRKIKLPLLPRPLLDHATRRPLPQPDRTPSFHLHQAGGKIDFQYYG